MKLFFVLYLNQSIFSLFQENCKSKRCPSYSGRGSKKQLGYIIQFKDNISIKSIKMKLNGNKSKIQVDGPGSDPMDQYKFIEFNQFKGLIGSLNNDTLNTIKSNYEIESIEQDQIYTISKVQESPKNWGLSRISSQDLDPEFKEYSYSDTAGEGADVYIIDTGIDEKNPEFEGRGKMAANFVSGSPDTDENGHGTHVCGIIGSKSYGVAKKANLHGIKVLDKDGSGLTSDIIKGIEFVVNQPGEKKVINMSLGGSRSKALDNAVRAAFMANIPVIVAAGNESEDACKSSPASAKYAYTVGNIDKNDKRHYSSNYGKCVDIFAPGTNILSCYKGKSAKLTGTSMASPHVAGIAALWSADDNCSSPTEMYTKLTALATKGSVKNPNNSPNLISYSVFGAASGKNSTN